MMEKSDDPDHNGSLFSLDNNNAPRSFFRVLGLKEYHAIFCISCLIIKLDLLQFNLYLHDARERATCFLLKGTIFLLFLQSFKGLPRSTRNSAFYSFRTMHPEKRALLKLSENEKKSAFNAFTNTTAINFVYIHTFVNDVAMILMQRSNQSNAPDSPSSSHVQKAFLLIW